MDHLMYEITQKLLETYPQLEVAAFDTTGKRICSYPGSPSRRLSASPHPPKILRGSHFTAAIPVPSHGAVAFDGKISDIQDPDTLYAFAKNYIKILQEQESIRWKLGIENAPCSVLLKSLFSISSDEDVSYVTRSAKAQGYDLELPRVILLIELSAAEASDRLLDSAMLGLPAEIRQLPFFSEQDIIGWGNDHQIAICKALGRPQDGTLRERFAPSLGELCTLLQTQYHICAKVSVSPPVQEIRRYVACLTIAQKTLMFAKRFGRDQMVHFYDDYLLETEISQLPPKVLDHFFASQVKVIERSSWMAETIDALVRHQMALDKVSCTLYIHRNTLAFRLRQIRKTLRLDPVNRDSDYFTLMVLNIYLHLYHWDSIPASGG